MEPAHLRVLLASLVRAHRMYAHGPDYLQRTVEDFIDATTDEVIEGMPPSLPKGIRWRPSPAEQPIGKDNP